jgi:hypothetical protein
VTTALGIIKKNVQLDFKLVMRVGFLKNMKITNKQTEIKKIKTAVEKKA